MEGPIASQQSPYLISVEQGQSIVWCACGRSENQPFCDGAHSRAETGITPIVFKAEKTGRIALCGCRSSNNGQFCDGTHAKTGS